MTRPSIIRFDPSLETSAWPDIPVDQLTEGTGRQSGRVFFEEQPEGIAAGLWHADQHITRWAPAPDTALYILLSGDLSILERTHSTVLKPGDAVVVPQGVNYCWRQLSACRLFYFRIKDRGGRPHPGPLTVMRIHRKISLSPLPPPARELITSAPPTQRGRTYFTSASGDMSIGVWESTPYARRLTTPQHHELMHLIQGAVTYTDEAGAEQSFAAGDTFLVPRGTPNAWTSRELVRKIYASHRPTV
jgi:uncharacterized cupin superfamily protein